MADANPPAPPLRAVQGRVDLNNTDGHQVVGPTTVGRVVGVRQNNLARIPEVQIIYKPRIGAERITTQPDADGNVEFLSIANLKAKINSPFTPCFHQCMYMIYQVFEKIHSGQGVDIALLNSVLQRIEVYAKWHKGTVDLTKLYCPE